MNALPKPISNPDVILQGVGSEALPIFEPEPMTSRFPIERFFWALLTGLTLCFALGELFTIGVLRPLAHGRSLMAVTVTLAFLLPELALCAFLFSLPLFGNKPDTPQFQFLLLVQCSLVVGLVCRRLFLSKSRKEELQVLLSNRISTLVLAYGVASLLSLSSLPISALIGEMKSRWVGFETLPLAANFFAFVSLAEDRLSYSILSVFLTLLAIAIGREIFVRTMRSNKFAFRAGLAILLGLIASLVFGLLDYYRFIDLRAFRGLDPIVNPGNAQFRLQSFFGHSGWYAEYVTLAVPFTLLLLAQRFSFGLRVAQCLMVLLVGEYTLILTYQRGGWISYPLTLFAVWAAIYVVRKLEKGEKDVARAVRSSMLKVCLSLPLTLCLSLLLIQAGMRWGLFSGEVHTTVENYISRFGDIQKTSDRTDFMVAGFKIGALHPILGAGSESFGYQFHKEFELPSGHFPGELNLPLHGTAHTLYFQIFSGKGVLGLTLLLILVFSTIVPAIRAVFREAEFDVETKVNLLAVTCFLCSFLIYGVVQEIFYIQVLQLLFFAVLGMGAALLKNERASQNEHRFLWFCLASMFALHVFWEKHVYAMMNSFQDELVSAYGCYGTEAAEPGKSFRWCGRSAKVLLERKRDEAGAYAELKVRYDFLSPGLRQANLRAFVSDAERLATTVPVGQDVSLRVPLSPSDSLVRGPQGLQVEVVIETDSYFIPQYVFHSGNDYRILSYRLYGPEVQQLQSQSIRSGLESQSNP